uniref:RING-type domain-containing protein n=1 Tax=Lotharella globosa TaxID=91324 RepID=A0A7S4DUG3_9EUKA|mmetsp:Transcript_31343/g.60483  ORF Transcript_31343/g.60483 Transcript_31343/m.60483 type:complete len:259 (-) Transcript_31343:250-1026(-)|eukprot:CAMPEP_0167794668 /NCGR_PEP_ID=MMETSP0111_2-20121227/13935_1 /TAXON_ID=91324 /ORGANISM="Lotharella globosa, Strain CCCM811" /LENGTH=258 /DNA_ID=CAMNT_0007688105 /DNA_START=48 /DNA_END=824 /DNA_ORIENTATION=-
MSAQQPIVFQFVLFPREQQQQQQNTNGTSQGPNLAQMGIFMHLLRSGYMADAAASMGEYARQFWEQAMNPQAGRTAKPASEEAVRRMPVRKLVDEKDHLLRESQKCAVCQEAYCKGDEVIELPCSHCYHKDCAMPWLKEHNTCPLCRKSVDEPKQKEADAKFQQQNHHHHHHQQQQQQQQASANNAPNSSPPATNSTQGVKSVLSSLPVRALKAMMDRHSITHDDCIEKAELVERVMRRISAPDISAFLAAGPQGMKR